MDRGKAWDEIVEKYDRYLEDHANPPTKLKLPVRYACNLMLEGTSLWGDFFKEIQQSGIRALNGRHLLGMAIEIVIGSEAKLSFENGG